MQPELIAKAIGEILGSFILVTIISRLIWYLLTKTKLASLRLAMLITFIGTVLLLFSLWTSATQSFDVIRISALASATLLWLFLDWMRLKSQKGS